jgi:hypothetical protein
MIMCFATGVMKPGASRIQLTYKGTTYSAVDTHTHTKHTHTHTHTHTYTDIHTHAGLTLGGLSG